MNILRRIINYLRHIFWREPPPLQPVVDTYSFLYQELMPDGVPVGIIYGGDITVRKVLVKGFVEAYDFYLRLGDVSVAKFSKQNGYIFCTMPDEEHIFTLEFTNKKRRDPKNAVATIRINPKDGAPFPIREIIFYNQPNKTEKQ